MRLSEPTLGADAPINVLRELWAALDALHDAPGCDPRLRQLLRFLLAALRRYDDQACTGLSLDQALGLRGRRGADQWWRQERLANRDRLLRDIRARFYPELDPSCAAAAILRDVALLDRQIDPPKGSATEALARAARYAPIPGSPRALRGIVAEINSAN